MNKIFQGYKVYNYKYYLPHNVLLSRDNEKITVAIAKNAIEYMIGKLVSKNLLIKKYDNAKKVLKAMKQKYSNQTPGRVSKEEFKDAIDVITEIKNENLSDEQKDFNDRLCTYCKILIDCFNMD